MQNKTSKCRIQIEALVETTSCPPRTYLADSLMWFTSVPSSAYQMQREKSIVQVQCIVNNGYVLDLDKMSVFRTSRVGFVNEES